MLVFIIGVILILFLVFWGWTWGSLEGLENKQKIICVIIGTIITYTITLIVFSLSKGQITYPNIEIESIISRILVLTFTPLNGFVIVPQLSRWICRVRSGELEEGKLKIKIIILAIVFVCVMIWEHSYLTDTQTNILKIFEQLK